MSDQYVIQAKDAETADAIKRELAAIGIQTQPHNTGKPSFTGRFGKFSWEPIELLIVGRFIESVVDRILDKFKERATLRVNGEERNIDQARQERLHQADVYDRFFGKR